MSGILVVGDSITAGQYCDPPHWPELIGAKAYGVSNDTTREGMQRLPAILDENPDADVVLIQFGHNDCNRLATLNGYRRVPRAEFESNIEEMAGLCYHRLHHPAVYGIAPHRTLKDGHYELDRMSYAAAMRKHVNCIPVPVLDQHFHADGIHLNQAGHRSYADTIRQFLGC